MKEKESPKGYKNFEIIKVDGSGSIICGTRKFSASLDTIRNDILQIIARSQNGRLSRLEYQNDLIAQYIKREPTDAGLPLLFTEPYLKRQNNVDKALSRLRKDLTHFFKNDVPEGTSWLCFSKKIDGWLLYRLPGLGCDGQYHW